MKILSAAILFFTLLALIAAIGDGNLSEAKPLFIFGIVMVFVTLAIRSRRRS